MAAWLIMVFYMLATIRRILQYWNTTSKLIWLVCPAPRRSVDGSHFCSCMIWKHRFCSDQNGKSNTKTIWVKQSSTRKTPLMCNFLTHNTKTTDWHRLLRALKAHHRFSGDVGPKRDCPMRMRDLPLSDVVHCGILSFILQNTYMKK